jgi:hypothetical protein
VKLYVLTLLFCFFAAPNLSWANDCDMAADPLTCGMNAYFFGQKCDSTMLHDSYGTMIDKIPTLQSCSPKDASNFKTLFRQNPKTQECTLMDIVSREQLKDLTCEAKALHPFYNGSSSPKLQLMVAQNLAEQMQAICKERVNLINNAKTDAEKKVSTEKINILKMGGWNNDDPHIRDLVDRLAEPTGVDGQQYVPRTGRDILTPHTMSDPANPYLL